MPQYIKSHSNYVLKSKHQTLGDGSTIFERDITTIGGLNQFAPGQTPIYRSNNFIITVRDDGGISNQYNRKKWTQNKSGDIWTMTSLEDMVFEENDQNDTKIVLKQDYYDFRDFCYYGSLAEMFRASITDIIARFPGELYGTSNNVYYTTGESIDGEWIEDRTQLGDDDGKYYIVNPFGINMHARNLPKDADPLKYFANRGFENYVIVSGETEYNINEWRVDEYYSVYDPKTKKYTPYTASTNFEHDGTVTTSITSGDTTTTYHPCKGEKVGAMDVNHIDSDNTKSINLDIFAWLGDNDVVYYLSNDCQDVHIRPNSDYINKFYDESDNFQKLILNRNTTPKYKATFSVIKEDDNGYYRDFEDFIFPTSEGGYNIDASSYGFNTYTTRLSQIGEFYDEFFTDNLYRSMTHEAIKNFDWTYTREYVEGDEEEYVLGGQKIQKALRVFAREFDEILAYINNIKNLNRVTYDERGNLPDYFLTDTVENEGWNVELVTPYDTNSVIYDVDTCDDVEIKLTQPSGTVKPYDIPNEKAYFLNCCNNGIQPCEYVGSKYYFVEASANEFTKLDTCSGTLRNRIKRYTDDMEYTYHDANNEFLRRLKLNSRAIWRHKGTLDGIDMILSLFGMRSKKYCDEMNKYNKCKKYNMEACDICDKYDYDYDVTEYTSSVSDPICDNWDAVHQMYHIDWINSTKTITYDYRSLSNYDRDSSDVSYIPYQGLPVSYVTNGYFRAINLYTDICADDGTGMIVYHIDKRDNTIRIECNDQSYKVSDIVGDTFVLGTSTYAISGDYIKDCNGSKVKITWDKRYLFPNFNHYEQYDGNPYFQMKGGWLDKEINGKHFQFNVDDYIVFHNDSFYKETVRNIRRFDSLQEMLSVPSYEIHDNQIVYVSKIQSNSCVLDGVVYDIKRDSYGRYIELVKQNDVIKAGDDLYFTEYVTVYNRDKAPQSYYLNTMPNGQTVKAYITDSGGFMCAEGDDNYEEFKIMTTVDGDTNYYVIGDFSQSNRIYDATHASGGWKRLKKTDKEYKMLSTIINDNKGNNPHNGTMQYDNGKEYFEYFKQLFKYSIENDLFDERCYDDYEYARDVDIAKIGWSSETFNYSEDVNSYSNTHTTYDVNGTTRTWGKTGGITVNYKNNKIWSYVNGNKDTITNKKFNTKVIKITFRLHYPISDSRGVSELKYIDDIVLNYLTQMIPSSAILQIKYETR